MLIFSPFCPAHAMTFSKAVFSLLALVVGLLDAVYRDPSSTNSPAVIGVMLFCLYSMVGVGSSQFLVFS